MQHGYISKAGGQQPACTEPLARVCRWMTEVSIVVRTQAGCALCWSWCCLSCRQQPGHCIGRGHIDCFADPRRRPRRNFSPELHIGLASEYR